MIIKRVGPLSCAKIAGAVYAAIGLLMGFLFSSFALVGLVVSASQRGIERPFSPIASVVMGVGSIIVCPILYGALGFVFALIGAWVYNLFASKIGGIEVEIT